MKGISLILFLILSSSILSEDVEKYPSLSIDIQTKGEIEKDDGYSYFYLEIPENVKPNTYNLVLTIKENSVLSEFSDPDLYVSKTVKEPNYKNSTWSCEQYGQDIVSINSKYVYGKEKFYIAVYCQFKCNFALKASLIEELSITEGKVYSFHLSKDNSLNFKFTTINEDYHELSMAFVSLYMKPFKVYVSTDPSPSSANSLRMVPSWGSGFALNIRKDSDDYCLGCTFHILIVGDEKSENQINFLVNYLGKEISLLTTSPVYDNIDYNIDKCYSIDMKGKENESLIISTMLFSGSLVVQLNGYNTVLDMTIDILPNDNSTYEVTSERVIILSVEDIKKYKAKAANKSETNFHFCLIGYEESSYMLKAHFESQIEKMQRFNYLLPGGMISGYLPKGHVTSYRLLEFTNDANITVNLDSIEGNTVLYGYFGDTSTTIYFDKAKIEKEKNNMIIGNETFIGYDLDILNKDNKCHNQITPSKGLDEELRTLACALYIVVECADEEDNCVYRLRAFHDTSYQKMIPRTSFYNILPKGETDYYTITIDDKNTETITIVMNSITGDTDLVVTKEINGTETRVGVSYNDGILPDVVTIAKGQSGLDTLDGVYNVKVKSLSFSTYSIYYYSKSQQSKDPSIKDITLELETGQIVYDILPTDTKYKIYSYQIDTKDVSNSDIRITLTRRNFPCVFYVFRSLNTFSYNEEDFEEVRGYDWKGEYNNELVISKNETKYSNTGPYYIVVSRTFFMGLESKEPDSFYIGVTDEKTPFVLFENMQHSIALSTKYQYQAYWYAHPDTSYDFTLSVNVLYGNVNVYIDFTPITRERIDNAEEKNKIFYQNESTETVFITIKDVDLQEKCKLKRNCMISIFIERSSTVSQYIIIGQSRKNLITYLIPGLTSSHSIALEERQYFVIEEYSKEKKYAHLYAAIKSGDAEIYMNSIAPNTNITINSFPTEKSFEFQAEDSFYRGKIITFPLNEQCNPCRYLITVIGTSMGYTGDKTILYTLTYSNRIKTIKSNSPIQGFIQSGSVQYYTFVFGEDAKNIYVSLTNLEGDANIYLNYGEQIPTFERHHWKSENPSHHFINIEPTDSVLLSQGIKNLGGVYTLMIYGFSNATYTLIVTDNDKKITPISNNSPGSCMCQAAGDKCYFRFDLTNDEYEDLVYVDNKVNIVFTTHFTYGSGDMFAILYNDTIYTKISDFPSETKYDYSNLDMNKRNFLKLSIPSHNIKLNKKSMLLLSVVCHEESLFDINAAMISNRTYYYLDLNRENIFYLTPNNTNTVLSYYLYVPKDLNYEVYSYTGNASIVVYQNYSTFDNETKQYISNYNQIDNFNISKAQSAFGTVKPSESVLNKLLFFQINPTSNVGLYVKLNYNEEWTKMIIGEQLSYLVNYGRFFGYFDIPEQYQDVYLTVMLEDIMKLASVYVKINMIDIGQSSNYTNVINSKYDLPNENNFDYSSTSTNLLSSVSLKIKEISKEKRKGKLVRALVYVHIPDFSGLGAHQTMINVLISPAINNIKRVYSEPLGLYFANENITSNESTVFDITKSNQTDDMIIIELSSCNEAEFETSITSQLSYFQTTKTSNDIKLVSSIKNGRKVLTILNATASSYYLNVWPKEKDADYLMYYYTANSASFSQSKIDRIFSYNVIDTQTVELVLPELKEIDFKGEKRDISFMVFSIFVSNNLVDFVNMESLCYLSRMKNFVDGITSNYDEKKNVLVVKGLKEKGSYFVNLQMKNMETGEIFVFQPIQITMNYKGLNIWVLILIGIVFAIILAVAVFFFMKYRKTKEVLKFQINDVRGDGPTKTMAEMGTVKSKYATLTDEISVNL